MKRILMLVLVGFLGAMLFIFSFGYSKAKNPYSFYQVYLDGKNIGMINSKRELENYINNQGKQIRKNVLKYNEKIESIDTVDEYLNSISLSEDEMNTFNTLSKLDKVKYVIKNKDTLKISQVKLEQFDFYIKNHLEKLSEVDIKNMKDYADLNAIYLSAETIYTPNGIDIKKVYTYKNETEKVSDLYAKIISEKNCTIAGYKFTIKGKDEKEKTIYVTDNKIFSSAIDTLAEIFVGTKEYTAYKENNQNDIVDTGSIIESVYVDEDITYKATNISTSEKIYTNSDDLAKYLLYGDEYSETKVKVEDGDSISSIAFNNQISVNEFLISNDEYTSEDNLLYAGKEVTIAQINPQVNVVVETHSVSDVESNYNTIEQHDSNMIQGDEVVTQEGEKGIDRITQSIKSVNGQVNYVQVNQRETLKAPTAKIVTVGSKVIPTVGSTKSWGWPTAPGYTITSGFEYRINPVDGSHELHSGIDIAGTGYGSPVYVTNNGTITKMSYAYNYGNHIFVDHGNGFYTVYAHMSGFVSGLHVGSVVERGQQIGYVGATGYATGPHLHYEIRTCERYACITNPLKYY